MSITSPKELYDTNRETMRLRHCSRHTEETYLSTIKRFIEFHGKRHPKDLGAGEIRAYLSHLAIEQNIAASTQNVAFNALLFPDRGFHPPIDLGEGQGKTVKKLDKYKPLI